MHGCCGASSIESTFIEPSECLKSFDHGALQKEAHGRYIGIINPIIYKLGCFIDLTYLLVQLKARSFNAKTFGFLCNRS